MAWGSMPGLGGMSGGGGGGLGSPMAASPLGGRSSSTPWYSPQRYLDKEKSGSSPDQRMALANAFGYQAGQYPQTAPSNYAQNQYNMIGAMGRYNRGNLQDNFGLDMRGVGLDRRDLAIDSSAAGRQVRNTVEQERLARAMLGNSQQAANQQAREQTQTARSEATAAGAFTAPGIKRDLTNIYANLSLGRQRNEYGFQQDLLGIRENRASARDRQRSIAIESQRLGLTEDRLRNQLKQGLEGSRLDQFMSVNDLFDSLMSGNQEQQALARQIIDQIMGAGG